MCYPVARANSIMIALTSRYSSIIARCRASDWPAARNVSPGGVASRRNGHLAPPAARRCPSPWPSGDDISWPAGWFLVASTQRHCRAAPAPSSAAADRHMYLAQAAVSSPGHPSHHVPANQQLLGLACGKKQLDAILPLLSLFLPIQPQREKL